MVAKEPTAARDLGSRIRRRGLMLVLSSPSGAGKSTIARNLLESDGSLELSVSVTTRPRRGSDTESEKRRLGSSQERLRRLPPGTAPPATRSSAPSISGTDAATIRAATPLAEASSCRCPSSPKPVTSVIALGPTDCAARAASAFKVVITSVQCRTTSRLAVPRFAAVVTAPPPV